MNDDLYEGPLLCRKPLFRAVTYSPTDVVAPTHDRRPVKLRWAAYTDRQRRALRFLLDPDADTEVTASRRGDVHVYRLSTDGDAKSSKTATTTADEETTTADEGTTTADERTTTTAHKGTNTSQTGPAVAQKATTTEEPEEDEDHVVTSAENPVLDPTDGDGEDVAAAAGNPGVPAAPAAEVGPEDGDPSAPAKFGSETDVECQNIRCRRAHDGRRSCVDLKGLAKLRKLCCLLRANVAELRHAYESRCDGDGPAGRASYTASEHQTMTDGLRALRADVSRLVCEVQEASGYRDEIADAVVGYKNYESRYRSLRTLNKNALSRTAAAADDVAAAENAKDDVGDSGGNADQHVLKRWLSKYFCDPCYRLFKRFMPSE